MYILSPIANTVLRNTTGYFSFHYRRYFRTPPLSCPITLSGTLPISSAMTKLLSPPPVFSTPPSRGNRPYILRSKTQGGEGE